MGMSQWEATATTSVTQIASQRGYWRHQTPVDALQLVELTRQWLRLRQCWTPVLVNSWATPMVVNQSVSSTWQPLVTSH
jgi:hypothetical protein